MQVKIEKQGITGHNQTEGINNQQNIGSKKGITGRSLDSDFGGQST